MTHLQLDETLKSDLKILVSKLPTRYTPTAGDADPLHGIALPTGAALDSIVQQVGPTIKLADGIPLNGGRVFPASEVCAQLGAGFVPAYVGPSQPLMCRKGAEWRAPAWADKCAEKFPKVRTELARHIGPSGQRVSHLHRLSRG